MSRRAVGYSIALLAGALLAAPALADAPGGGPAKPASAKPSASASDSPHLGKKIGPRPGFTPDPPVRATTKHWQLDLTFDHGKVSIDKVTALTLKSPESSKRVMGRFALELWVGKELLDRVRFDVPLLGDQRVQGRGFPFKPVTFDALKAKVSVQIADSPRAAYVVLLDRAADEPDYALKKTNLPLKLAWPPDDKGKLSALPTLVAAKPAPAPAVASASAPEPAKPAPSAKQP